MGDSNTGSMLARMSLVQKLGNPNAVPKLFGQDFEQNAKFAQSHPDAAPPAKGQSYQDYSKQYGDAHPQTVDVPAASNTNAVSVAVPPSAPQQPQQPTTYSAPQKMTQVTQKNLAMQPQSPTTNPQAPKLSPQTMPPSVQAAKAANQMAAGQSDVRQFAIPSVSNISFGGS